MPNTKKVFIIGLDCATPELIFEQWKDDLPNIKRLINSGVYGRLESTIPPITIPAWTSMMTSKDPGTLGLYGFRNRSKYTYEDMNFATASQVKEDAVWDILSRAGKKVALVGIPQTYPPKPVNGNMISCFLTPSVKSQYTYPKELKNEIEDLIGEYLIDVKDFRTTDKDYLLRQIYEMTEKRFEVIKYLMKNKEWDFFMFVEMGTDRIHHGMWKYFDKEHIKHEPGSQHEDAIKDYYKFLDKGIGDILSLLDNDTIVFVVSDHGSKKMDGGICINEWLIREGYLTLKEYPNGITPFNKVNIDWENTIAWGEGGYYARVFMNVKGREPQGVIEPENYETIRNELVQKLEALGDEKGKPIGTKAYKPQELYKTCNGLPPDLIVLLGDLYWRSVGTIGHDAIYTFENDTGPDDANHAQHGILVMSCLDGSIGNGEKIEDHHLMDIAPTVLNFFGIEAPNDMQGKVIEQVKTTADYDQDEEEEIRKRLEALGYVE
ncbi:MAG: alkaline phosphatase family protein [Candidatus Brocadiaceae bacterium]|nr:alkaline phosphatase family protein [Candidatus Brocadiaceae bacterium]